MPSLTETPPAETPVQTRPNPVRLTDRAAAEVRRIAANKQIGAEYALRVGVKGGGCSGMSYILGYDTRKEHDLEFEENGVSVVMDRRQGLYLMGAVVDYHDGLDARGFVFDNPNATTTCGCGSSFAA